MVASASQGGHSPARAASSVGTISHHQEQESFTDDAESRPQGHVKIPSTNVSLAENTLHTSANSVSVAPGDSSGEQKTAEIVTSTPPLALPAPEASSRPTDEQIIAQENSIRAEVADRLPFVGDIEPLATLEAEYRDGNSVFRDKIHSLEQQYNSIRRTRGDGNCAFRAFIFAYMEQLVNIDDLQERNRVVTCLRQWKNKLVEAGFQELVFEDAMEVVIDQLNSLGTTEPLKVATLEENMRDSMLSPMIVMLLRLLTSAEIQRRTDFFAPFVMGLCDDDVTVQQFCTKYVEPMGEESDHIQLVALTDALLVPVRVVYLDRSMGAAMAGIGHDSTMVNHHDFIPEAMQQDAKVPKPIRPRVHVLYRPGHYDILYPHASAAQAAGAGFSQ